MRRTALAQTVVCCVLALAVGCGDDSDDDANLPDLEDTSESPSQPSNGSEKPDKKSKQKNRPGGNGLTFSELPDVKGAAADVLDAYIRFEELTWQAYKSNRMPAAIRGVAGDPAVVQVNQNLSYQRRHDLRTSGRQAIRVDDVEARGSVAVAVACSDDSKMTNINEHGEEKPVKGVKKNPTSSLNIDLVKEHGTWRVNNYNVEIEPC